MKRLVAFAAAVAALQFALAVVGPRASESVAAAALLVVPWLLGLVLLVDGRSGGRGAGAAALFAVGPVVLAWTVAAPPRAATLGLVGGGLWLTAAAAAGAPRADRAGTDGEAPSTRAGVAGPLLALVAVAVVLAAGTARWVGALGLAPAAPLVPGVDLAHHTLRLEGPLRSAEVAYPGLRPLEIVADLRAGEALDVGAWIPAPVPVPGLAPAAPSTSILDPPESGIVRAGPARAPAPPPALGTPRPTALDLALEPGARRGRLRARYAAVALAAALALGVGALARAGRLAAGLVVLVLGATATGVAPRLAPSATGSGGAGSRGAPELVLHERTLRADGGPGEWWTTTLRLAPADLEGVDPGAHVGPARPDRGLAPRLVVAEGAGVVGVRAPGEGPAAVRVVAPRPEWRFKVLDRAVNAAWDLDPVWIQEPGGAAPEALGPWRLGAPLPEALPKTPRGPRERGAARGPDEPPRWAFGPGGTAAATVVARIAGEPGGRPRGWVRVRL
ncbi:MAG: hypothetical protein AAFU73_13665 [Planctomycetota bacterium]